jgi:lipid-binding SYLF domain-containing protein
VSYYKTAAASVGLLAGAESKSLFILFMTQEALDKYKASNGWTVGERLSLDSVAARLERLYEEVAPGLVGVRPGAATEVR